jgi:hypothetical protein
VVPHLQQLADLCACMFAEHLSPGETYREGAVRGLAEELGIHLQPEAASSEINSSQGLLTGPVAPAHARRLVRAAVHAACQYIWPTRDITPRKIQQLTSTTCAARCCQSGMCLGFVAAGLA